MAYRVNYFLTKGGKSIPLNSLPEEAWQVISGGDADASEIETLYSAVGMLRRGVNLRANALLQVPWYVRRGSDGEPVYDYRGRGEAPEELAWLDDLPDLLWLIEAGMTLSPEVFLFAEPQGRGSKRWRKLRWLMPQTVEPVWDSDLGIVHYKRTVNGQKKLLPLEQVIYFAVPNPFHETKPGQPPAAAAAAAAGVVYQLDAFAQSFFERGAIRATLLSVPAESGEAEKRKLKAWYQKVVSGVKNAFSTNVISSEVQPITIGDGASEIADSGLTESKQKQIALALGIPFSKPFADAANYATSIQDNQAFYEDTFS